MPCGHSSVLMVRTIFICERSTTATAGARLAQTKLPQVAFIAFVRNPSSGSMPPFRAKVLSDQDLADIYAYIKTFPEPRAAKDIPLLNQ